MQVGDSSKEEKQKNILLKSDEDSTMSSVHKVGVACKSHESPSTTSEEGFVMVDKSQINSQQEREGKLLLPGMWKM